MVKEFAKECATPLPDKKKNRTLAPSLNEKIKLGKQPDTKAEKMSKDIISRGFMQPLSREKQIAERTRLETTHKYIMASCSRWPDYAPPPSHVFRRSTPSNIFKISAGIIPEKQSMEEQQLVLVDSADDTLIDTDI